MLARNVCFSEDVWLGPDISVEKAANLLQPLNPPPTRLLQ